MRLTFCVAICLFALFAFTKKDKGYIIKGSPAAPRLLSISKNDERNIKAKAEGTVTRFMDLLNVIATGQDIDVSETEEIMRRSYVPVESKIFYDSAVIVEDDLRKVEDAKLSRQKPAYSYLRDFEIFYKKSDSSTVNFSNFKVSNVKQGKYIYIKVHYDCLFTGQSKISNEPYSLQKRVAELRVEKVNNKWRAWVVDVHYEDSADLAAANANDIPVVDDNKPAEPVVVEKEPELTDNTGKTTITDPAERERIRRKNDSIRTYMAFRILIDSGKHALNGGKYIIAYQFFNEAENVVNGSGGIIRNNDKDFLETMIGETKRNIDISNRTPEQNFQLNMQQALLKESQRKYADAVDAYNRALGIKPAEEAVKAKIRTLTTWINNLARLDAKFMAGNFKDAIKEYDKAIAADPSNSDYYVGRGKCFDKTKDTKKALADFQKAIELDQNNLEAYKAKGLLHERMKSIPEAIAAFTVCTSIDKSEPWAFVKIAELHVQKDNTGAAIAMLDKGITNNPQASTLYARKGAILQQQKQSRPAIQAYSSAIAYDSINAQLYFQRALCNMDIKDISSAGYDFVNARRLGLQQDLNQQSLNYATEFYNAGLEQLKTGRLDVALSMFANARLIDPSFAGYHYQAGYVNLYLKKYDEAIENFTDAIVLDSRYAAAYQMRGLAKYFKGLYRDCVTDFEKSVEIDPKVAESYKYLGDAQLKLKDYNKAIARYDEALDANESRKRSLDDSLKADLYYGKGVAGYYTGDFKHALSYFNQSIKLDKNVPEVFYYRGLTYLKQKEYKDATENIEKALASDPRRPLWNSALGEINFQKGKFDKALLLFDKAISEDTARAIFPESWYQRANCYYRLNDFQAAVNDFEKIAAAGFDKKYPEFNTLMGHSLLYLDQPDSAMVYFNRENKLGLNPLSLYGTAIVYVLKAQPDMAFKFLDKTMIAGKVPKAMISGDKRLASIRGDKRYKALMKKYY